MTLISEILTPSDPENEFEHLKTIHSPSARRRHRVIFYRYEVISSGSFPISVWNRSHVLLITTIFKLISVTSRQFHNSTWAVFTLLWVTINQVQIQRSPPRRELSKHACPKKFSFFNVFLLPVKIAGISNIKTTKPTNRENQSKAGLFKFTKVYN